MKRLLFALLPALLLFGVLELTLILANVADPLRELDTNAGFSGDSQFVIEDPANPDYLQTNTSRYRSLHHVRLPKQKPDDVIRVMIIGGSNVYLMYDHFEPVLTLFNAAFPGKTIEIINMGALSYGSHRLVHLTRAALRFDPDLFILYSGHNEFEERRFFEEKVKPERLVTHMMGNMLNRWRTYLLLKRALRSARKNLVGMYSEAEKASETSGVLVPTEDGQIEYQAFSDPAYRDAVLEDYRKNLTTITDTVRNQGVPVLISTVASNLFTRPFSPCETPLPEPTAKRMNQLLSEVNELIGKHLPFLHGIDTETGEFFRFYTLRTHQTSPPEDGLYSRPTFMEFCRFFSPVFPEVAQKLQITRGSNQPWIESRDLIRKALDIQETAAALFTAGLISFRLEDYRIAETYLRRSADLDCSPRKSTDLSNRIIQQLASERSIPYFDGEGYIRDHSFMQLPGWDMFEDHCHLNIQGQAILLHGMAREILDRQLLESDLTHR